MRRDRNSAYSLAMLMACAMTASGQTRTIELRRGLVITSSVRVRPKAYRISAPASLDSAVITIRGNDIVVDFSGVTLEGIARTDDPDLAAGARSGSTEGATSPFATHMCAAIKSASWRAIRADSRSSRMI
jgi:hypothetical protein